MTGAETGVVQLSPRLRGTTAGGAVVLFGCVVVLYVTGRMSNAADDLLELGSAQLAAGSCGLAACGAQGRLRIGWAALAAACASWSVGEAIWSVYELALHRDTPFPSFADVGFLLFPVGACVALLVFPARATRSDRRRMAFDGLTAACAIALVSWSTALGAVYSTSTGSLLAKAVGLAYPVSDIALLIVCVLVLSRASGHRRALALVAAGLALMAVADSAFAWATAQGSYDGGALLNLGWYAAFGLLALAPMMPGALTAAPEDDRETVAGSLLPYLPLTAAVLVETYRYATGHHPSVLETVLCAVLMALVLGRQALTGRDNRQLALRLTQREQQLRHQAFHDGLTGLANRALYVDRVTHALDLHRRDGRPLSLCFLDLDGFKQVNDALGHSAGDELLVQVAQRFAAVLSGADTLARFGGDEFAVLLEESPDPMRVAHALLECLATPFVLLGKQASVSVSIGVARIRRHDPTPTVDELLTRADLAMYAVKRNGKSGVLLHTPGLQLASSDDLGLSQQLARALTAGDVTVAYQPIVELATGRVHTLEALARWAPLGVPVEAGHFVRIAEHAGLLDDLFGSVLDEALTHLETWDRHLQLALNVAPSQLTRGLFTTVASALVRHGIEGSRLVLELTGTDGIVDLTAARQTCEELRKLGIQLAVDGFGTGSASFARLRDLPIDKVKIDRSFVTRIDHDVRCQRFVRAVLAFAEELDLQVIAEGVEQKAQRDALTALGCHMAQGYLFSVPLPAPRVPVVLHALPTRHTVAPPLRHIGSN
jgi:diguanylate cyclase (GGDEF)-like protein